MSNGTGIAMRIQILPNGLIVGHVVPESHPANGHFTMKENHVYELQFELAYGREQLRDIGEADVKMFDIEATGCGLDKFIALAGGKHLTVNNRK